MFKQTCLLPTSQVQVTMNSNDINSIRIGRPLRLYTVSLRRHSDWISSLFTLFGLFIPEWHQPTIYDFHVRIIPYVVVRHPVEKGDLPNLLPEGLLVDTQHEPLKLFNLGSQQFFLRSQSFLLLDGIHPPNRYFI